MFDQSTHASVVASKSCFKIHIVIREGMSAFVDPLGASYFDSNTPIPTLGFLAPFLNEQQRPYYKLVRRHFDLNHCVHQP